ncbi:MFS transporter [Aestuariivirga sp.]|uniref:MFS transporter n=1 Tax=Aestuariivirga sp. TaxID=2650926 RepID=UPI003BA88C27
MENVKSWVSPDAGKVTAIALSLAMLLASLGTSIANIALPSLAQAFGAPFREVQMVVVAYLAALTVSVIIAGRLGDRRGLRPMLVAGLVLFAAASLLCALAPSLGLLVGARALQGVGAAFLMTLAMALMRQTAGEAHIGRAMGLLGTVSALGTALGPSLGGLLIPLTGWRGIFWVQFPLVVFTLVLIVTKLPREAAPRKQISPSLWSVTDRHLMPSLSINILVASVMMATLVVGPFFLAMALDLNPAMVGFVMSAGPIISILSGVPSGRLVDRWGTGRVLVIGLTLLAAGAFLLAALPGVLGVAGYLVAILVLTPGYQLFQSANNTSALSDVPKNRQGTVSGLLNLSRNVGLIAGASAMGAVFAYGAGTQDFGHATDSALVAGMQLTFIIAGLMMILALIIAAIGRVKPAEERC